MELIVEKPMSAFDLSGIGCGYLLWGRHSSWEEGKAGIVTSATESQLIVQYHPGIGNVINHFIIPVTEAADGQWEIRWSKDLSETFEYGIRAEPEEPEPEKPEPGEQILTEPEETETEEPEAGESKPEDLGTEEIEGGENRDDTGGIDM